MDQTFSKEERLCRKSLIKKLFDEGDKQFSHPFRIIYLKTTFPGKFPVQLLISVPRSLFKHAVDRNRVKRLIREAYRKNKYFLYESLEMKDEQMLLSITYISKEIVSQEVMTRKIIVLLQRLKELNAEVPR